MVDRPKKRPKKHKPPIVPSPLKNKAPFVISQSDLDSLDDFCKAIDYEAISVETWESCLAALEVRVPLWIDIEAANQGADITVRFSRRILNPSESGILKEAVQIILPVPAGTKDGSTIIWPGYGDRRDSDQGNLVITIHIRSPRRPH